MRYLSLFIFLIGCDVAVPGGSIPGSSKPYPFFTPTENPPAKTPQDSEACITIPWEVHFSPKGGCTEMVSRLIRGAKESVFTQAYSFTSGPIGQALVDVKNKHVTVQILLDKSDETVKNSQLFHMEVEHVPVWIDNKHAIAHNKLIIIDHKLVITGSFNFTVAAENSNAENCIALFDVKLAQIYLDNWKKHREHSVDPKN